MKRVIRFLPTGAALLLTLALAVYSRDAADGIRDGLSVCAHIIIPSLFPLLAASLALSELGIPRRIGVLVSPLMRRLFGVSGLAAAPLVAGLCGGYPMGAVLTAELCRRGELSRNEAGIVLGFCNNSGPAFIIGAVGVGVFGSPLTGAFLYAVHALSAVLTGLLLSPRDLTPDTPYEGGSLSDASFSGALTAGIRAGAGAMVNICAFVIFFSAVISIFEASGIISAVYGLAISLFGSGLSLTKASLYGFLELGNGVSAMSGLPCSPLTLTLTSAILGWGGLSVHFQTAAVTLAAEISCARHFAGRSLSCFISAVLTFALSQVFRFL